MNDSCCVVMRYGWIIICACIEDKTYSYTALKFGTRRLINRRHPITGPGKKEKAEMLALLQLLQRSEISELTSLLDFKVTQ